MTVGVDNYGSNRIVVLGRVENPGVLKFDTPPTLLAALIIRTAARVCWKSPDPVTRLLYGVHSHVQQIPILAGQVEYYWNRYRGRRRLI